MNERRVAYLLIALFQCIVVAALAAFLGESSSAADGVTKYVAPGGDCGGANPCYATIQDAVDAASAGDTIRVAQGVYTGRGFQVVYIGKAITLAGGYTTTNWIDSDPQAQPTVIDAENVARRRGIYIHGTDAMTITVKGFDIQRGYSLDANGGGIYVATGRVAVQDCRVIGNVAERVRDMYIYGGGMSVQRGTVTIADSIFERNTTRGSSSFGGGLWVGGGAVYVSSTSFLMNSAGTRGSAVGFGDGYIAIYDSAFQEHSGDAVYLEGNTALLSRNYFLGNGIGVIANNGIFTLQGNTFLNQTGTAVQFYTTAIGQEEVVLTGNTFMCNSGGGVRGEGEAHLQDNRFVGNSAADGAGLYIHDASVTLRGNVLLANSSTGYGSALYINDSTVQAENDIIAKNAGPWEAIYLSDSTLDAQHWTIAENGDYALVTPGGSTASLINTIVASHDLAGFWGPGITADYTLFFDTETPCGSGAVCTNSLFGNPKFVNANADDYHIQPNSAAANAGIDAGVSTDIDGEPRPMGSGFDIGADEVRMGPFLAVAKTATPDSARPGALLTYTLYVTNTGTVSLTTSVTDSLPAQVTPTGEVTWIIPPLPPSHTWSETVLVTVEVGYLGPLTNVLQVSAKEGATGVYTHTVLSMKPVYLPIILRKGS